MSKFDEICKSVSEEYAHGSTVREYYAKKYGISIALVIAITKPDVLKLPTSVQQTALVFEMFKLGATDKQVKAMLHLSRRIITKIRDLYNMGPDSQKPEVSMTETEEPETDDTLDLPTTTVSNNGVNMRLKDILLDEGPWSKFFIDPRKARMCIKVMESVLQRKTPIDALHAILSV